MAMKIYAVIMMLETAREFRNGVLNIDNLHMEPRYFLAKSDNDAISQAMKVQDVCDHLMQGAKVTNTAACEVPATICSFNQTTEWAVYDVGNGNSKLLSIKTDHLPKEALQDLQAYANKWCGGVSLS